MQRGGGGIQHRMVKSPTEIVVAPDRFEVTGDDAILVTELRSSIAVCIYDAVEEAGALLHLRCIVRVSKPADMTDTTLATELLLLAVSRLCVRSHLPPVICRRESSRTSTITPSPSRFVRPS